MWLQKLELKEKHLIVGTNIQYDPRGDTNSAKHASFPALSHA